MRISHNFVSYIYAKYHLNYFLYHTAVIKVVGVNFFETQCIYAYARCSAAVKRKFLIRTR